MKVSKRMVSLFMVLLMLVAVVASCGPSETPTDPTQPGTTKAPETTETPEATEAPEKSLKMVMITDAGGLGDGGFNDMAWHGLEMARDELGFEIGVIESTEAAQFAPNISQAAEQGYDIVVCVGFLFVDVLAEVAPQYPDTSFIMIDAQVEGDNVYSFLFDVQESSYLAGALAALVTEGDTYGFVGGMEIPVVLAWESGYVSGVKTIKPDAEVKTAYVGTFSDPGDAKELALAQFNDGAEVVLECSSGGAIGVIEAARDADKAFIATDKSKDSFAPGYELTAALAHRDQAVFNAAKLLADGTAVPGTTHLTMKDGVFGLPEDTEARYGADVVAKINQLIELVKSGEVVVPATREAVAAFEPPVLD